MTPLELYTKTKNDLSFADFLEHLSEVTIPKSKKLQDRENKFRLRVMDFKDKYHTDLLVRFIGYWTERTYGGKQMLFETQKAFEISRRLATWASKDFNKRPEGKKVELL